MLGLQLRDEFRSARLRGTTIDFTNDSGTGALDMKAQDFLRITYPSIDLIKSIKAAAPGASRAVVLIGNRGQGKSHLMAALSHLFTDPVAGEAWLKDWAVKLQQPELAGMSLRSSLYVIAEPLHEHRFAYLWDILFAKHPKGEIARARWKDRNTEVPGKDILKSMFEECPTALILDEFQTWFDGLSDTNEPKQAWAFNFIQLLSEIAEKNPELLTLIVSIREGSSNAAQQLFRDNPVRIDFKGEQAQHDRRHLLLYRIFENRINIPTSQVEPVIENHLQEYMRLGERPSSEVNKHRARFVESWPYSPELLQLLDDEVIFAVQAQGTRDLVRILVELFKAKGESVPVITAADFDLSGDDERGSAASLIDTIGIDHHKQLRDKALRNLTAVEEALGSNVSSVPHLREIISALWLRSLSLDNQRVGAEPETLQTDVTRSQKVDDNAFQAELATIENNSYNIHKVGTRLVFKLEENARTRLLAHARNDKLFQNGEDVDYLALEVRHVIGGDVAVSNLYRTVVLKREWNNTPWDELDERQRPSAWDNQIPLVVLPDYPEKMEAVLGAWLTKFLGHSRNTIRFLLPRKDSGNIYRDKELMLAARAAYLAKQWQAHEPVYKTLSGEFNNTLKTKIGERFDRFAVLFVWNFNDPSKCRFSVEPHGTKGSNIPQAIQDKIKQNLFIGEDFDELVLDFAKQNLSMSKLVTELREPRSGGSECIPWLGDAEVKDKVLQVCATGQIAIHVRGLKTLQTVPGEDEDMALRRMKRDFDATGKQLDDTVLSLPGTGPSSAGQTPVEPTEAGTSGTLPGIVSIPPTVGTSQGPTNLFGGSGVSAGGSTVPPSLTRVTADPTSSLNLLGKLESWQVGPATTVRNVAIKVDILTGAQLAQLLKDLPVGVTYGLEVDKEGA